MYIVEVVASCVSAAEVAGLSLWPQGEGHRQGGHTWLTGAGGGKLRLYFEIQSVTISYLQHTACRALVESFLTVPGSSLAAWIPEALSVF